MKRRLLMKLVIFKKSKRRPRRRENQDFLKILKAQLIPNDGFRFVLEVISKDGDVIKNTRLERVIKVQLVKRN